MSTTTLKNNNIQANDEEIAIISKRWFEKIRIKRFKFTEIRQITFLIILSILTTYTTFILQPGDFEKVKELAIDSEYMMPLLNLLPILFFALILHFITGNLYVSSSATYIIFTTISYLNKNKIIFREEPLTPADFMIGKEAFSITKKAHYSVDYETLIYLTLGLVCINLIIYVLNVDKPNKYVRIIFTTALIICSMFLYQKVYTSAKIWNELPRSGSLYNLTQNYIDKGVVYSFIHHIDSFGIKKPQNFDKSEIDNHIVSGTKDIDRKVITPNLVMIMGEAFSDISRHNFFKFDSEEDDPMKYFKKLEKEAIVSGHIVVSTFGGGTSNTEFDVLTGCPSSMLNKTTIVSFETVRKPIETVTSILKQFGYDTLAMHPGFDWFYNRKNVYKHFGFDKLIFEDDFVNPERQIGLINDKSATKRLIEEFENKDKDKPIFEYCVTMQNHGPYPPEKYPNRELNKNFKTKKKLSDEMKGIFSSYFQGIRDMDIQIHDLTDYFKSINEPVIFVYYGDHLPFLAPDKGGFKDIDYGLTNDLDGMLKTYEIPYIIWANKPALKMMDINYINKLKKFDKKTINASYIGATVLGLMNMDKSNLFFEYVNNLKNEFYVMQRDFAIENENNDSNMKPICPDKIGEDKKGTYDFYKNYTYYKLVY